MATSGRGGSSREALWPAGSEREVQGRAFLSRVWLREIAVNQNSTIILPVPIDLFKPFLESQNGASSSYGQEVRAARIEEEKEAERLYEEAVGEVSSQASPDEVRPERERT